MNPYQYSQELQYQQQYGQQAIQFVPYAYNVGQQPRAVMGQYGGPYPSYPTQANVAVGQTVGNVSQNQMPQTGLQSYATFTPGQNVNQPGFQTTEYQTSSDQTTGQTATMATTSLLSIPQIPSFPAMPSIADINQQYTEQYQKWQQQYTEWQAQHANHPDQKLFQEYQKQVEQWQQQQQQLLTVQGAQVGMPQQPVAFGTSGVGMDNNEGLSQQVDHRMTSDVNKQQHQLQTQQFSYTQSNSVAESSASNQLGTNPLSQNLAIPQKPFQNTSNKGQKSNNQWNQNPINLHLNQGQNSVKQFSGNTQNHILQWNQNTSIKEQNPSIQLDRNVQSNTSQWNQHTPMKEQIADNQLGRNVQSNTCQWNQNTPLKEQNPGNQFGGNSQGKTIQLNQSSKGELSKSQFDSNAQWNQNSSNNTHKQFGKNKNVLNDLSTNTVFDNQKTSNPNLYRNAFGSESHQQQNITSNTTIHNQELHNIPKQQPNWLNEKSQDTNKTQSSPTKYLPKWLQVSENQAKKPEVNTSKTIPKWLKTESTANVQAITAGSSKPLPKWLQETRSSVQEQSKVQTSVQQNQQILPQQQSQQSKEAKPIPKWLQQTKVTITQQSTSTTTTTQSLSPQHISSISVTSTTSSLSALVTSTQSSSFSPQKLHPKEELELLQKQSMQLLQLAQLERQQKESKAETTQAQPIPVSSHQEVNTSKASNQPLQEEQTNEQVPTGIQQTQDQPKVSGRTESNVQVPKPFLKTVPCKFFPNCRNGVDCKFKHPPCSKGESCTTAGCIFDHTDLPEDTKELDGDNRQLSAEEAPPPRERHNYCPNDENRKWYPESRGEEGYRDMCREESDWHQWKKDWPGDPRDERPSSTTGRAEPHWDEEFYQRGRDEWDMDCDRYRWKQPPPDFPHERQPEHRGKRWPPEREHGHEPQRYEEERWRRPQEEWNYPKYRDDRRPLSPRYRRDIEYGLDRRERPYYDQDNHPLTERYGDYNRNNGPQSPGDYDRRREWEERDRTYYDRPPLRDAEWRDGRGTADRYHDDYTHSGQWTQLRESHRDSYYDRESRYREPERWESRNIEHQHPPWNDIDDLDAERYEEAPRDIPQPKMKKAVFVPVESILDKPGRDTRPDRFVIILRGLPGSGKTHVARLIKDKEVSNGAHAPRIIGLDDYFLTEVERQETDSETGKRIKKKVTEFVYEEEMEETYMASMFKSFTKTLEDGFFPTIMVDAINNKVKHFERYWSLAKQKGFEVYIAELSADSHVCAKRNCHQRSFADINKILNEWEEIPSHMLRLDVRALLQDAIITEVEMETADTTLSSDPFQDSKTENKEENEEDAGRSESGIQILLPQKSKWDDMDSSAEAQLNKLDGIRPLKRRRETSPVPSLSDDDDPYDEKEEDMRIGKKRVRWADLEERKHMEHRRRIGFCIGTDWSILTDPHAKIPEH